MEEIDYRNVTGLVHSTESFGAVDGTGIQSGVDAFLLGQGKEGNQKVNLDSGFTT